MDATASDDPSAPKGSDSSQPSADAGTVASSHPETTAEAHPVPDAAASGQPEPVEQAATADGAAPQADATAADGAASGATAADADAAEPAGSEAAQVASDAASADGATAGEAGAAPEGGGRKRKRRRKKKAAESPEAAAEAEAKRAAAPFARLFPPGAPKRHAFAVGEVIAGRVQRAEDGGIVVDLFGKAVAVADEFEPREIPPMPVAPAESSAGTTEAPPEGAVAEGAVAEGAVAEGAVAEGAVAEGAVAEGAVAEAAPAPAPETTPGATPSADAADATNEAAPAPEAVVGEAPAPVVVSEAGAEPSAAMTVTSDEAAPAPEAPTASAQAPEAAAAEAAAAEAAPAEARPEEASGGSETASGDLEAGSADHAGAPQGPVTPVPVVPEELGRPEPVTVGGIFKGRIGAVAESGHIVILNRNIDRPATKAQVRTYRDQRRRVQGLVFGFNRGGFDVLVSGIRAFCPASAMALGEIADPESFVGRKYEFLLPSGKGGKDLIVSRRSILEREARKRARELLRTLKPGQQLKGKVTSVRDFGVFVDVGGIEGLVHQSELSYGFGVKPASVASVGDEVEVQVLRVGDAPKKKGAESGKKERRDRQTRVSLSIKALLPDPWDSHADALAEGGVREGKVTRTTDFGAFVELVPSIEGLVHISDFGRDLAHANQAVTEGEMLHVVVERVDRKARRISLSRLTGAELEDFKAGKLDTAAAPKNIRQGATIKVVVDKPEARGIVVRVPGAIGRRARGFVPGSETGTERGSDLRKRFPIGSELEVKVIGQDRDGGLKCSIKALRVDEERQAVRDYRREASKQGFGTFGDLLKAKLGQ